MPFDTASGAASDRLCPPPRTPSPNRAERDATARFARLFCADLAGRPETERGATPLLLLVGLHAKLKDDAARMAPGEAAVAWVPQGVSGCPAKRRALALRLASAGAAAGRQSRHIERLGFLAA